MSFNFIYNPLTNEKYSIFSYEGKTLLKQYIKYNQTGGSGMGKPQAIANRPHLGRQPSLGTIMAEEETRKKTQLENYGTMQSIKKILNNRNKINPIKNQETDVGKCRNLKFQMERAQQEYYSTCDEKTIEKNKQNNENANKRIPDFTNLGN